MISVKLEDCFEFIRNGANIKQKENSGGYPITRIETISNDKFNRERMGYAGILDIAPFDDYVLHDFDLLMSHINSVVYLGRTVLYRKCGDEKIIHGMNLLCLRAKKNLIFSPFIKYYFSTREFKNRILRITKKSVNQASFSISDLKEITIPLPPLSEQKRIADILDRAEAICSKQKELLSKYDLLIKAVFVEMFGDPVKNEKKYDLIELAEVCSKIGSGATPKGGEENYKQHGISLIRSLNVYDNNFKYNNLAHIDNMQAKELDNVEICSGDVLFNITGASVTRTCIVPDNVLPARVNQHVAILRCMSNVNNFYLTYLLSSDSFKKYLLGIAKSGGATREAITKQQLEKTKIMLPSLAEQTKFASIVQKIEKLKQATSEQLTASQMLFASLSDKAFKGEL